MAEVEGEERTEDKDRSDEGGKQIRGSRQRSQGGGRGHRERKQARQPSRPFWAVVKTLPFNQPEIEYNEQSPRWIK